jgi:DNA-binding Xre family transcriptional regulator
MRLLTINEIRERLQDRRLEMVSEATGLHYNTVLYLKTGTAKGANISTIEKLSAYLLKDCECDCISNKSN